MADKDCPWRLNKSFIEPFILSRNEVVVITATYTKRSEHRNTTGKLMSTSADLVCGMIKEWGDKTKNIFLYFFTKLKTYHPSYSI